MKPNRPGSPPPDSRGRGHPVPWRRITAYFLASRVFIYVLANLSGFAIAPGAFGRNRAPLSLDLFRHWDANWYLTVAIDGYMPTAQGAPSTAFFPLYPLLLRIVGLGWHDLRIPGYLLSNACLLGSCLVLWKLAVRDSGRENVGDRAVLFFLFNPVSLFYSTLYSESLFFLLMIGLAWFATERRWLAAGCCGYLAGLTRPVGVLLVSLLIVEFIAPRLARLSDKFRTPSQRSGEISAFLVSVAMTLAGLGVYCLCLDHRFGDPFAFLKAEAGWSRHFAMPWTAFEHIPYPVFYIVWFCSAVVLGLILLVTGAAFRLRISYLAMGWTYFLLYISTNLLEAIPRFLSVLFPFYLVIALVAERYPRLEPLLFAGSVMLLTLSTILFVNGYWFT